MLAGYPPFYAEDRMQMYRLILRNKLMFLYVIHRPRNPEGHQLNFQHKILNHDQILNPNQILKVFVQLSLLCEYTKGLNVENVRQREGVVPQAYE